MRGRGERHTQRGIWREKEHEFNILKIRLVRVSLPIYMFCASRSEHQEKWQICK